MERLFENDLVVEHNGQGEIFVHDRRDPNGRIRITPRGGALLVTAHNGVFTPWSTNGLPAFLVRGKPARQHFSTLEEALED